MATFARETTWFETSLSLWRFRSDRGEISHFFWTGSAQSDLFAYTIKALPAQADPLTALSISDPRYVRRLGHSVEELTKRVRSNTRWRRLLTVMLMASAFERYLFGVAATAVASDPARIAGFPKRIDGLMVRKHGIRIDGPSLGGLVKGAWPSRTRAYRILFGSVPPELTNALSSLEKLRVLRNSVAHGFAHTETEPGFGLGLAMGARRSDALGPAQLAVSERQVVEWLRILGEVAEAIDKHLCKEFIGGFETAALFIDWRRDPDKFELEADISLSAHKKGDLSNRFATVLGTLLDRPPGTPFVRSIQRFVDGL